MKNFLKYFFLVVLCVLLVSTLFSQGNKNEQKTVLDSNILEVESSDEIAVDNLPKTETKPNGFSFIAYYIMQFISKIFDFIFSLINKIFMFNL